MKTPILTYGDYIPNEQIKKGDVFQRIYEVVSEPKITALGYEWKVFHKKCDLYLRMLRPDPRFFLKMDERTTEDFISAYHRIFIPMQLHPRIEAFYDVRHIGGSAALLCEWTELGSLRDCIENCTLYQGNEAETEYRLLRIAGQIARAAQFLETEGIFDCATAAESIMLTDRMNAKLSVANLMVDRIEEHQESNLKLWAVTVIQMYLGKMIPADIEEIKIHYVEYRDGFKFPMPERLEEAVTAALYDRLPDRNHFYEILGLPSERNYEFYTDSYRNNFIVRLIDCGKWDQAYMMLAEHYNNENPNILMHYNFILLNRYLLKEKMTDSYGGIDRFDLIGDPTDILLYAESSHSEKVRQLIDSYDNDLPEYVARYLPEIREKLLDRPQMTSEVFKENDQRMKISGGDIMIELGDETVSFKPLPGDCEKVRIPGKDGLVWDKSRLVLPDSSIHEDLDYTVKKFSGDRFLFDEGFKRLLVVKGNEAELYHLARYDDLFRAPFLLYRNTCFEDDI